MTLGIIGVYLVLVLGVGLLSHRLFRGTGEDYFLATRSIGPFVLLMTLFGTHMTAFSLLGASGEAYRRGIGVFSLMASSSAIVVPVVFLFVGVRLWTLGKRHGFVTQVEYFRERWQSPALGIVLFVVLVALVVPYLLIGVLGGGLTLSQITGGAVPRWAGSLAVSLVVLCYVTFGGLRGTAWANTFQTLVFMTLGAVTFFWVIGKVGGLQAALRHAGEFRPELLVRGERMGWVEMSTYAFIPLSVGMFPHIFMHWLTARSAAAFRLPVIAYPLCVTVVWLPSVLLGVVGAGQIPGLEAAAANSVLVRLIDMHAPDVLAGLLAAGVFAAIMSSLDSQVLSLGTMFTRDVVGRLRRTPATEGSQVATGRAFVAGILTLTYAISLFVTPRIFQLAVWSFTGFAGLFPLAVAALYWRRSTASGALAAVAAVVGLWLYFFLDGFGVAGYTVAGTGIMPVAVITVASAVVLAGVSLLTAAPPPQALARFFP